MSVRVYRNLHSQCLSVQSRHPEHGGWRVGYWTQELALADVQFRVSQAGRQRVLNTGRKNVHAFVCGDVDFAGVPDSEGVPITYNPRKHASFVNAETGEPVIAAWKAVVTTKGIRAWGVVYDV